MREQIFHGHMAKERDKVNLSVWWKQDKGLLPQEHHFLWKTGMRSPNKGRQERRRARSDGKGEDQHGEQERAGEKSLGGTGLP